MKTLEEYLQDAERAHGHLCAGQVLGVRMAMLGLSRLGIDDPIRERKRLITFVEIDRCATDAVAVVTGCRLGKRVLKFRDWGKVAATFVDLKNRAPENSTEVRYRAIRLVARESSKQLACSLFPEMRDKNRQQMAAYRQLTDAELFNAMWVEVELPPEEFPGYHGHRVTCEQCGEGINFKREVLRDGRRLCRACAGEAYYRPAASEGMGEAG